MALENNLGLISSADLAREEERISKKKALDNYRNVSADFSYVIQSKFAVSGGEGKIRHHQKRNYYEYRHKKDIRKRRITGFYHFSSSPVILCII